MMPLREQFVHDIKNAYDSFIETCQDAAPSVVAWELYDPCKVAASDEGSFANRGWHFNSLVMPMWSKPENDARCRQFARDLSNMFKKEIQSHGASASGGVEGGVGIRGRKGAVMLYGNYDVSVRRPFCDLANNSNSNTTRSPRMFLVTITRGCRRLRGSMIRTTCSTSCLPYSRKEHRRSYKFCA